MRWLVTLIVLALAGCADPPADPLPGTSSSSSTSSGGHQGFAPQQGTAHGETQGIELDVTWRACEAGFCANATARNNGSQTVQISSICVTPWEDRMSRDGEPVQHRPAQAVCLAYGRAPFAPGDVAHENFTWNGHLYSEGNEEGSPAPAGAYDWTFVFWWEQQEGGSRMQVEAEAQVLVGIPT